MNALIFDTLAYARRLQSAGFSREQSEALAEEQARLIDERLATKADVAAIQASIEALRLATKADIEALRLSTKADLAETKFDILKWMIGALGLQTIAILGALLALARLLAH